MAKNQQTEQTTEQLPIGAQPIDPAEQSATAQPIDPTQPQISAVPPVIGTQPAVDKSFPVTATVCMDSFVDEDTKEKRHFVTVMFNNPFEGEVFDVRLEPKWERDRAIFKHIAKRNLMTCESFGLKGSVIPSVYKSKRTNKFVTAPAIKLNNIIGPGIMEFVVKGKDPGFVFSYLVSQRWNDNTVEAEYIPDGTSLKNV